MIWFCALIDPVSVPYRELSSRSRYVFPVPAPFSPRSLLVICSCTHFKFKLCLPENPARPINANSCIIHDVFSICIDWISIIRMDYSVMKNLCWAGRGGRSALCCHLASHTRCDHRRMFSLTAQWVFILYVLRSCAFLFRPTHVAFVYFV